jgi:hypothetical protein
VAIPQDLRGCKGSRQISSRNGVPVSSSTNLLSTSASVGLETIHAMEPRGFVVICTIILTYETIHSQEKSEIF